MATDFISWQFTQLLIVIGCGMLLGVFHDLYNLCRYFYSFGRRVLLLTDFVWWGLAFILIFGCWFYLTVGDIRFYYILWQLMGFVLYCYFLSPFVMKAGKRLVNDAAEVRLNPPKIKGTKLYSFFPWLFMLFARFVFSLLSFITGVFRHLFRFICHFIKRFLPPRDNNN